MLFDYFQRCLLERKQILHSFVAPLFFPSLWVPLKRGLAFYLAIVGCKKKPHVPVCQIPHNIQQVIPSFLPHQKYNMNDYISVPLKLGRVKY